MRCFHCFGNGEGSQVNYGIARSKRWIKHGRKSSTSCANIAGESYGGAPLFAQISGKGEVQNGVSQASLRIVSASGKKFIPVIFSPAAKPSNLGTEIISISPMKTQKPVDPNSDLAPTGQNGRVVSGQENPTSGGKEDRGVSAKRSRRSWVRVVKKKASGFLTASLHRLTRNGKVRQDPNRSQTTPSNGSIYTDRDKPIEFPTAGPQDNFSPSRQCSNTVSSPHKPSTRAADANCKNLKPKSNRLFNGCGTAPASPRIREIERAAHSILSSYAEAPVERSHAFERSSSFESSTRRVQSKGNIRPPRTKAGAGYDTALNLTGLVIILGCLVLSDRLCAIACTSLWWYMLPEMRNLSKRRGSHGGGPADSEDTRGTMPSKPSTGTNNVDPHSSEYRKKVIMDGLLQRNRKL